MKKHELHHQKIQPLNPAGLFPNDVVQPLTAYGINGASDHVIGLFVHDKVYPRDLAETTDNLSFRVAREVLHSLPVEAKRDANGRPIAHYIYDGLDKDHCKP